MDKDIREIFASAVKVWAVTVCMVALLALACLMCGCRTQYVPMKSVRTEYVRTDSVLFEKVLSFMRESVRKSQSSSDTTILKITNTYTLDADGDTIKSDTNTQEYRSTSREVELERTVAQLRDSNLSLQRRLDSQRVDTISVPHPVERELSKWERVKMDFGGLMLGAVGVLLIAGGFLLWLVIRKRKV